MARIVQLMPTSFIWPADYPGGTGQKVFMCELGCLVLERGMSSHQAMAHS